MIETLITKIQTLLETITDLQVVYPYERADADGTPFATITPSSNENAYETTSENHRIYAFTARFFVERKGQSNDAGCETTTRALVDKVLNLVDRNWGLNGVTVPIGYTLLFMEAAPSAWGYVGREMEYRVAEVKIKIHFSIDVNLI
jgi:hypothetical protein